MSHIDNIRAIEKENLFRAEKNLAKRFYLKALKETQRKGKDCVDSSQFLYEELRELKEAIKEGEK